MPRIEYERCDLPVSIAAGITSDSLTISVGAPGQAHEAVVGITSIEEFLPSILEGLFRGLPREAFIWNEVSSVPEDFKGTLFRVVLDIVEPDLASFDWEGLVAPTLRHIEWPGDPQRASPYWPIVRVGRVRPKVLNLPMTLPIRTLHVAPRLEHRIKEWVRGMFGHHPADLVDQAVLVETTADWSAPASWRTVDIVQVDDFPWDDDAEALTTAAPTRPCTLGWLARWTDRWQTRLLILHATSERQAHVARRLARALCDKGGPAVLVVEAGDKVAIFYRAFYMRLIHDDALDSILWIADRAGVRVALFAGTGREEAVRPSNLAKALVDLAAEGRAIIVRRSDRSQTGRFLEVLRGLVEDWNIFRFETHEHEGLLPLTARLMLLRQIARGRDVPRSVDRLLIRRPPALPIRPTPAADEIPPRVVNASFWSEHAGQMELVPQKDAVLRRDQVYHLGLVIGPKDTRIVTLNLMALLEEQFKWEPGVEGAWVEIGITGIDFTVLGDPVQQVWLPRRGASDPLYIPVVPRTAGIAQLRVGLYYEHNLIQSFRMAASVTEGEWFEGDQRVALADALEVGESKIGDAGYMARLEYSRTSALQQVERTGGRALSITANELDGRNILTIKGDDIFQVDVYPDDTVRKTVARIRSVVNAISYAQGTGTSAPLYQFGPYADPAILDARFDAAIVKLASAGVTLFTTLAPDDATRDALTKCLAGSRKVIQAAQLLRKKVIPWGFVYDRLYDEYAGAIDGVAVEQGVCRAALPASGATPRATACGEHPECLLSAACQDERRQQGLKPYHERTVACPLHFWGFSHMIEVPPQQVEDGETAAEERTCIVPTVSPLFLAGLSQELDPQSTHWTNVSGIGQWAEPQYARDAILEKLRNPDLDLIYFFCHARGGEVDPHVEPPYLDFDTTDPKSHIRPQDLADKTKWTHGPLIVLNACGTVGYSPDALSPFLKALVDGRGAGGILGTEVPVAEILATDVAKAFFERFVAGKRAGEALLDVRWELLARRNPLGLVYTLYAPAALALDVSGKGDCSQQVAANSP